MGSGLDSTGIPDTGLTPPTSPNSGFPLSIPTDLSSLPSPSDVLDTVEGGTAGILDLFAAVSKTIPQIAGAISAESLASIPELLGFVHKWLDNAGWVFDHTQVLSWDAISNILPTSFFFKEMLQLGLGLEPDTWDSDATNGVKTIDTMLAFSFVMPMIAGGINAAGKTLLANRWPDVLSEALVELPQEMGLSWALGLTIDEAFKTAVGRTIEESINREKRPNRIEWQILRQLLRQHIIPEDVMRSLLENNGFPDEQIGWILSLSDALLPIGDLQQLYLYDLINSDDAKKYIKQLGFSDDDTDKLWTLYIDKADTASGAALRSTYRQLYRDYLVTESQYKQILTDTNFPTKEIANDIAAINEEHTVGRIANTTSIIKSQRLHNTIDDNAAIIKLQQIGYSNEAATELVASWLAPAVHPRHGLTQSKILSYFISGILDRSQAYAMLMDTGLSADSTTLVLDHPNAHPKVTVHNLTPSFVITAYLDGAIDETTLSSAFTKAGVSSTDMDYWLTVAHYRYAHKKSTPGGTLPLSKGEVIDAFKYGIFDRNQAQMALEALDYDSTNATILLEIANKGKFQVESAPYFQSLTDAIAYLTANGFEVHPPPDPKLLAAESMVANAGYSYTVGTEPVPIIIPPSPIPIP